MIGFCAYSLAGHDKGAVYLIIDETEDHVYLADGLARPLDRAKKKNKKHIQVIKDLGRRLDVSSVTNEEIRHLIKGSKKNEDRSSKSNSRSDIKEVR